ncbi:MAG: SMI1/KNR4 family protein [Leptospiraceae bacterium]|nr:SMI1/KNR4 family protein [Leptospiraceae bacterium]MCP5499209.1 SMI1/KNR4 family protein [Leptospiraceae bacterium]
MSSKNIEDLIRGFDRLNMHPGTPRYTQREVEEFEKNAGCKLPPDYKKTLLAGYIDKGTFHFLPPKKYDKDSSFVVFGKWHDDIFLFDTSANTEDYPVYVSIGDDRPEKKFNNFYEWLKAALESVSSTNYPE